MNFNWAAIKTYFMAHKIWAIAGLVILLISGSYAAGYYWLLPRSKVVRNTKTTTKNTTPVKPVTKASPLTGVMVKPEQADRPITAAVIENHPDARPQSGLAEAGVVYEALAEGGITRFLAFYLETRPALMGPIRSLRTYFVDWALEFNAPVAHVGGNADALDLVGPLGMKDMNQFYNGSYFYRSTDRYAPHNVYTTADLLDQLEAALGYAKPASFTPSPRQPDAPPTTEKPATNPDIKIDYSYNGYQVEYVFDATCDCYNRFLSALPHTDRESGKQIQVKNVVVEYMPTSYGATRIGEQTVIMNTPGSGQALVFRDGGVVAGTWSKTTHSERTRLLDAAGKDIPLNAGNTWYSVVPTGKTVTY